MGQRCIITCFLFFFLKEAFLIARVPEQSFNYPFFSTSKRRLRCFFLRYNIFEESAKFLFSKIFPGAKKIAVKKKNFI